MTYLQEYDLEFKLAHTIKGHGLCKLAAEARESPKHDILIWEQEIKVYNVGHVPESTSTTPCYSNIQQFL